MSVGSDRSTTGPGLRSVALPSEHGGWSLTLEPVLLGLVVAWSFAGLGLGVAALGAFILRTPLKVVLVDLWRRRWLARTTLAAKVVLVQLVLIGALVIYAGAVTGFSYLAPVAIAAPLVGLEIWYDMRSRGRRVLPELAGSIGIGAAAAAIAIAGDSAFDVALGLWTVIAARSVAAIPYVRHQILRTRTSPSPRWHSDVAQVVAVAVALIAWMAGPVPAGSVVVIGVIGVLNVVAVRRQPRRAVVIGVEQVAHGAAVVATTATAVLAA